MAYITGPKDNINIRILQNMVAGIPLVLGLGTRMSDPYGLLGPYTCSYGPKLGARPVVPRVPPNRQRGSWGSAPEVLAVEWHC